MVCKNKRLSKSEVKQYHEEGWIGPFKLISPTDMANISHVIQNKSLNLSNNKIWKKMIISTTVI